MKNYKFTVKQANWFQEATALQTIREAVFVQEQGIPLQLEWDGYDTTAIHVLAFNSEGQPIGTGRLLPDGHIGRIAVLKNWRHKGVGTALLKELLQLAKANGLKKVFLDAQLPAIPFYQRLGFITINEIFEEAGILHQPMQRTYN